MHFTPQAMQARGVGYEGTSATSTCWLESSRFIKAALPTGLVRRGLLGARGTCLMVAGGGYERGADDPDLAPPGARCPVVFAALFPVERFARCLFGLSTSSGARN